MVYTSNSAEETQKIAADLAQKYQNGGIIAFSGPLGAGKTTFIQGFARGLGINDRLISPTFIVMRQYDIPKNPQGKLFHIDLYRFEDEVDIEGTGLSEIFANPNNIVLIEWAEKLGKSLPQQAMQIKIKLTSGNTREIEVRE